MTAASIPSKPKYLAPEVHSLMKVDRPIVRAADLDRVVLLVSEPMDKLKAKSPGCGGTCDTG